MKIILKPLGFKKKGINFHRLQNDMWMVFNFQSSSWNSESQPMIVYANIGLNYEMDSRLATRVRSPLAYVCHWQGRVPGNKGQAFEIGSDSQASETGRSVATRGLKILEEVRHRYPTPEAMLAEHSANRGADLDLTPWGRCEAGILQRELDR